MTTLMLIGDSITAGFDTAGSFPEDRVINKGVDGDSTVECLARIGEEWFLTPVDAVCICIGTNDIAQGRTDDAILATIERIVGTVRLHAGPAALYCTSIFPTRENAVRPNDRIAQLNARLRQRAEAIGCSFLDLHPRFTDDTGRLKQEFTEDGLHLTARAYDVWSALLAAQFHIGARTA